MCNMDDVTLEALKGSIKKWEMVVDGTGVDRGWVNCPLCKLFFTDTSNQHCVECPVSTKTGVSYCIDTPYEDITDYDGDVGDEGYIKIAQREVDFLKSLLPKNMEK